MEDDVVEESDPVSMETLERTAAWVKQVSTMKAEPMHTDPNDTEDSEHFDTVYKELLRDKFDTSVNQEIDIPNTVKEFKEVCEKLGISQRFAAKHIMEKTSQGNLSFLLDKGRHKKWNELSPRGRIPYIRMRSWLDNESEKGQTTSLLTQTKEYKKTGPKDGGCRREKFTIFQLMVLCRFFEEDPNPNQTTRTLLAEKLDASLERVTIWFQNQRARGFPAQRVLSQSNFTRKSVDIQNMPLSLHANMAGLQSGHVTENGQSNLQFSLSAAQGKLLTQPVKDEEMLQHVPHIPPVAAHSQINNQSKLKSQSQLNSDQTAEVKNNMDQASMGAYYNGLKTHFPANRLLMHKTLDRRNMPQTSVRNLVTHQGKQVNEKSQSNSKLSLAAAHNKQITQSVCRMDETSLQNIPHKTPVAAHSQNTNQSKLHFSSVQPMKSDNGLEKTSTGSYYNEFKVQRPDVDESDNDQPINFSISNKKS